jgi:ABC-type transport system involved in cytochrome bd biosynthesis fused ATPase/permease subunit
VNTPIDPVRAKRQKVAKWTLLANRVGYLFFALAIAVFVIAFAVGFNDAVAAVIIVSMVIGSVLLAPAIVLGYAVKAAERDDRERGL